MTLAEQQMQTGQTFIRQAEKHFQNGDMPNASKGAWDAVEFCLKSVAERRGWERQSHLDLSRVVSRLAKESDDPRRIHSLFIGMTAVHINFYEDWFEDEFVKDGIESAKELISILEKA